MIITYLEKIRTKYQEKRIDAANRLKQASDEFARNMEIMKVLEENSDSVFEEFTPREVNGFNKKKLAELAQTQKELSVQLTEIRTELSLIDDELYQLDSVIKVAKEEASSDEPVVRLDNETYDARTFKLAMLETQENERQRIAREFHDTAIQNIAALIHKIGICNKLVDSDPIRCKLELANMEKIFRDTIDEGRNMIYNLRPMSFDDIGFDVTLERFIDKFKAMSGANVTCRVVGDIYPISNVIQITVLRIIQEACNNAVKHANATRIKVKLVYEKHKLIVSVEDNGDGFTRDNTMGITREDNSGFGLSMMKERIYLLSGELQVESSLGEGCRVTAIVPIDKENNECQLKS